MFSSKLMPKSSEIVARQRAGVLRRAVMETLEGRTLLSTTPVFGTTIAQENLLTGTPDTTWDVAGAGDATIQGFSTSMSANVGQTISFKINDTKSASYHIDIYRVGYYQGNGARLVTTIPATSALKQVQPAPF